jgi:hypothetical protein
VRPWHSLDVFNTAYDLYPRKEAQMSRTKITSLTAISIFLFVVPGLSNAVAGEKQKIKAHGVGHTVKSEQIIVGDVEGHVLMISESNAVYIDDITGERRSDRAVNLMDFNPNAGSVFVQGYGIEVDKDGDKVIRKHEGQAVAKGQVKGTWKVIKCTGKYDGVKGSGTWTSYVMGQDQNYIEIEGEMESP